MTDDANIDRTPSNELPEDAFARMRTVLRPGGTAPVVNMAKHAPSPFYDADHGHGAIDTAQRRIHELSALGDMAEPLSHLEKLAITFLLKASGQYDLRNDEPADEPVEGRYAHPDEIIGREAEQSIEGPGL